MTKPIVAVVGRPNVGKSTLVNRLATTREAIVHEASGVTRDRSYHDADWRGRDFVLVDTGGIETLRSDDVFSSRIRQQAVLAVDEADVIVCVVDGSTGITEEDETVARILRRSDKPVFLVVNKKDNPDRETLDLWDFYALGLGEPRPISALHGHGTGDLLDEIVAVLPDTLGTEDEPGLSCAIIGRPNVGKSSLINRICNKERAIVSEVAGTTRDAIDSYIDYAGERIRLVDTAGIRKSAKVTEDIEYYSYLRALGAIERSDVCILVADAFVGITEQDQKLAGLAAEKGRGIVLALNKWDLITDTELRQAVEETIVGRFSHMSWLLRVNLSALTGRSVEKVLDMALLARDARATRLKTSALNELIGEIKQSGVGKSEGKRRLKLSYATQTGFLPPEISVWCNYPDLADDAFERFMERKLRERFELKGTPIRLKFRKKV